MLILLCLLGGLRNYNALLNSDQYAYLIYGRSLARGGFAVDYPLLDLLRERLPQGTYRPLFSGRRFYADGEVISTLEPGFPLLLAVAIRLGGVPAVFGVNVVLLAVFLISYFLVLRGEAPGKALAALGAVFLVLGWDNHIAVSYSLNLMRDIPPLAFFWLGLWLFLKGSRPRSLHCLLLPLGMAAVALSGLIRLTNLAIIPPLIIYALIVSRRNGSSWGKFFLLATVSVAAGFLVFLPQFLEEASALGDPFSFARRALAAFNGYFSLVPGASVHTFSLANLRDNLWKNLAATSYVITLPGLILLAIGIYACRRRITTWLIMLPTPLILLLLFSSYGTRARRYRFPLYPFAAYFVVSGAFWLLNHRRNFPKGAAPSTRRVVSLVMAAALGAIVAGRLYAGSGLDYVNVLFVVLLLPAVAPAGVADGSRRQSLPTAVFTAGAGLTLLPYLFGLVAAGGGFHWSDAQKLRREIERCVPAGAVVLGQRYLIQNIDFYTHAHGISPDNLTVPLGTSLARAVLLVEESGRPVFALDNRGFRSMDRDIRYLRRYFDLPAVCRWPSADLNLAQPYYSSAEELTLFRVDQRRRTEAILTLATPRRAEYLVLLDTGLPAAPVEGGETRVRVNDRELPVEFGDGLNYVLIGAADVSIPETELEVSSPRPLPSELLAGLTCLEGAFRIDFGEAADPGDELFVVEGLYTDRRLRDCRVMGSAASVLLPRLVPPGGDGWLELRIRNMLPGELPLNVAIKPGEGTVYGRTIPSGREWRTIKFPLPALSPRQGSFILNVVAEPAVAGSEERESLSGSVFMAIDRLEIGWREDGPESPGDE